MSYPYMVAKQYADLAVKVMNRKGFNYMVNMKLDKCVTIVTGIPACRKETS